MASRRESTLLYLINQVFTFSTNIEISLNRLIPKQEILGINDYIGQQTFYFVEAGVFICRRNLLSFVTREGL